MKFPVGWGPAVLAVVFHLQFLHTGGVVSIHRKRQPANGAVKKLRQALESRTEELHNQKNIAHGLELEVRELQSELQNEKKALATETQKEQGLEQKLSKVRAVLDDGVSSNSKGAETEKGSSTPAASVASLPTTSDAAPTSKAAPPPMQPLEESAEPLANAQAPEEPEDPEEVTMDAYIKATPKNLAAPAPKEPQQPQVVPPSEESPPVVQARQTTPQEPPPFFEALPTVATATKTVTPKQVVKVVAKAEEKEVAKKAVKKVAKSVVSAPKMPKAVQTPPKEASQVPAPKAAAQQDKHVAAALRGASNTPSKPVATKAVMPAATPAAGLSEANTAAAVASPPKETAAPMTATGQSADFDALEAQLHEEDRRIQDLDRENDLDAMTDGSLPPAPGSTPAASSKAAPAQPKLELDAEAPMEDFLNVDAPGPESVTEVGPVATSSTPDAPLPTADEVLALPQTGQGSGLEGALSDNQFLAQIAPAPRHA